MKSWIKQTSYCTNVNKKYGQEIYDNISPELSLVILDHFTKMMRVMIKYNARIWIFFHFQ
uniref:Uncharacterized protein n=1 Tax=Arundo donax TaxID=35708 RepID=A0A0A9B9J9_ARUDO